MLIMNISQYLSAVCTLDTITAFLAVCLEPLLLRPDYSDPGG